MRLRNTSRTKRLRISWNMVNMVNMVKHNEHAYPYQLLEPIRYRHTIIGYAKLNVRVSLVRRSMYRVINFNRNPPPMVYSGFRNQGCGVLHLYSLWSLLQKMPKHPLQSLQKSRLIFAAHFPSAAGICSSSAASSFLSLCSSCTHSLSCRPKWGRDGGQAVTQAVTPWYRVGGCFSNPTISQYPVVIDVVSKKNSRT